MPASRPPDFYIGRIQTEWGEAVTTSPQKRAWAAGGMLFAACAAIVMWSLATADDRPLLAVLTETGNEQGR
ncbi:hypothetical protein GCM10009853_015010 [Glycomyces scopariae]